MNNILSVFHGYLGLLMEDRKLDPILKEGLARIRGSACEATELIERINAIGRPASCTRRELSIPDFFRQLRPSIDALGTSDIQMVIECPADLPLVRVIPSRMKLAILELVRNACDVAVSRVVIRATASEVTRQPELFSETAVTETQWVRIEVIDDGPGIPAAEAGRIFEPFFSTKKRQQCAGLGLAVALGCVQQFGGTLEHRGRKGETIFEMMLPACEPQQLGAVA